MSMTLRNKLLQYAAEPPEKVWDAIAGTLDERAAPRFTEKLLLFEETPPPQVWNNINNQLGAPQPARVVPFFRRPKKLATYSAAAALLLFAAMTTTWLIGKRAAPTLGANSPATRQNPKIKTDLGSSSSRQAAAGSPFIVVADQDKVSDLKNAPRERKTVPRRLRSRTDLSSALFARTFLPRKAETRQTVHSAIPLEKYMVYSDGDGNAMKLPKKLFDFIACVKEDSRCKQEMQQLQQQFASAMLTTDFTGVLEVLKTLKENQ